MKTSKKLTEDCFAGKEFSYRDNDFDNWLPKTQPAKEGNVTVHQLPRPMTFKEMAQHFLGSDDIEVIKKHTLTLPMVEQMIKTGESELETTGWGNFYFLENAEGGVSVGFVRRDVPRWHAGVYELGYSGQWLADRRLLVCNLDSKTLEPSVPDLELRVEKLEKILAHYNLTEV